VEDEEEDEDELGDLQNGDFSPPKRALETSFASSSIATPIVPSAISDESSRPGICPGAQAYTVLPCLSPYTWDPCICPHTTFGHRRHLCSPGREHPTIKQACAEADVTTSGGCLSSGSSSSSALTLKSSVIIGFEYCSCDKTHVRKYKHTSYTGPCERD
jgi:hypothetical protein